MKRFALLFVAAAMLATSGCSLGRYGIYGLRGEQLETNKYTKEKEPVKCTLCGSTNLERLRYADCYWCGTILGGVFYIPLGASLPFAFHDYHCPACGCLFRTQGWWSENTIRGKAL